MLASSKKNLHGHVGFSPFFLSSLFHHYLCALAVAVLIDVWVQRLHKQQSLSRHEDITIIWRLFLRQLCCKCVLRMLIIVQC